MKGDSQGVVLGPAGQPHWELLRRVRFQPLLGDQLIPVFLHWGVYPRPELRGLWDRALQPDSPSPGDSCAHSSPGCSEAQLVGYPPS